MSYIIIVVSMLATYPMNNCHVSAFSIRHNNIAVQSTINIGKCRSSGVITYRSSLCNTPINIKKSLRRQTQLYDMQNDNNDTSSTANANANFEETTTTTTTTTTDADLEIIRGDKSNEISDDIWVDIEDSAPTKFEIMKNVSTCCFVNTM
jgi:hypothetical protein